MIYNFKSVNVKLNGDELTASNLTLTNEANLVPVYSYPNRHTQTYAPQNNLVGTLKISYPLTGKDFLKTYTNSQNKISGNISEMYFTGGYLTNYSLKATPNSPAIVDATIVFFDKINGTFSPQTPQTKECNILSLSDASLNYLSNYSTETITNIFDFNYGFSTEIVPVYYAESGTGFNNIQPAYVTFGIKQAEANIVCDNLTTDLPIYGKSMGVTINFKHPSLPNLSESITISGIANKKEYKVQGGQSLTNTINIIQNRTDDIPVINYFTPYSGLAGTTVNIYGSNFSTAVDIIYKDTSDYYFNVISDTQITSRVPYDAISGNLAIRNFGGLATFTLTGFNVLYEPVVVNAIVPATGKPGDSIQISGSGFYRVDQIFFSGQTGIFRKINSTVIESIVPSGVIYGAIGVGSNARSYTGYTSYPFVPKPRFDGFTPQTGISGDYLTITGWNFTGISYIDINGVSVTGLTVLNNSKIITYVPSGNTYGYIKITGFSGITEYSPYKFSPTVLVTGVDPPSGYINTAVTITGLNFYTGILYSVGDQYFKVAFDDTTGQFRMPKPGILTGLVPANAKAGKRWIYAYKSDGISKSLSNTQFQIRNFAPAIFDINAHIIWGKQVLSGVTSGINIIGENLFDVTGIHFTGIISNNVGWGGNITNTTQRYITGDILGKLIIVTGFPGFNTPTGNYELYVAALEGTAYSTGIHRKGYDYGIPSGITIVKNYYISSP